MYLKLSFNERNVTSESLMEMQTRKLNNFVINKIAHSHFSIDIHDMTVNSCLNVGILRNNSFEWQ